MKGLAKTTALVVATLLGLAVLWTFRGPTLIFLLSLVVAAAVRAPIEHLAGRGLPKPAALAGVYAAGFLVLAVLTVAVGYLASDELSRAGEDFRQLYEYSTRHSSPVLWIEHVAGVRMPPADELLTALLGRHGGQAVRLVLGTAFGAASAVVDIVLVVVLSIYWASDCAYFERFWLSLLPLPERASARDLWRMLETELGAYVRSEIAQSLLAGVLLGAGYHLLGLSYPALLAVIAAFCWLLPWLGAAIALVALALADLPALVLDWPDALIPLAMAALFTILVFAILETCLEPRLFNRRRYNSLFIVLAVIALAETCGILGLLLGPMVAVATQAALEHLERAGRRAASRCRFGGSGGAHRGIASRAEFREDPPREWMSLVERLEALIARAQEIDEEPLSIRK